MNSMDLSQKGPWNAEKTNPWPSMKKKHTKENQLWRFVELFNIGFLKLNSFAPEIRAWVPPKNMAEKSSKHPFFRVHFLLFLDPQGIERKISSPNLNPRSSKKRHRTTGCFQVVCRAKLQASRFRGGIQGSKRETLCWRLGDAVWYLDVTVMVLWYMTYHTYYIYVYSYDIYLFTCV